MGLEKNTTALEGAFVTVPHGRRQRQRCNAQASLLADEANTAQAPDATMENAGNVEVVAEHTDLEGRLAGAQSVLSQSDGIPEASRELVAGFEERLAETKATRDAILRERREDQARRNGSGASLRSKCRSTALLRSRLRSFSNLRPSVQISRAHVWPMGKRCQNRGDTG